MPGLGQASPWWMWPGQGHQPQDALTGLHLGVHGEADPANPWGSAPGFGDRERPGAGRAGALLAPWDRETRVQEA